MGVIISITITITIHGMLSSMSIRIDIIIMSSMSSRSSMSIVTTATDGSPRRRRIRKR